RDEDDVQADDGEQEPVADYVAVTARPCALLGRGQLRIGDEGKDGDEREKGGRVDDEEDREALGVVGGRDEPAGQAAEPDAEVARDALERVGGVAPGLRRESCEQGGLARPEAAVSRAGE